MFMTEDQFILLQESRRRVPRYLFRTVSASSRGGLDLNSQLGIIADDSDWTQACNAGEAGTKEMIEEHLTWNYSRESEFTSWSSSLLWTIRHAIRKRYYGDESAEDISICILDTANYGIPVYPTTALYDAYSLAPRQGNRSWRDLERHYFLGEYLLRGAVHRSTADFWVVSLATLEKRGLYDLLPEINDPVDRKRGDLARAVRDTRDDLLACSRLLTVGEVKTARTLGECYGSNFVFPVAVAFLSLRGWRGGEVKQKVLDKILDELDAYAVPDSFGGEEEFGVAPERYKPKEAATFRDWLRLLANRSTERAIESQAESEALAQLTRLTLRSSAGSSRLRVHLV